MHSPIQSGLWWSHIGWMLAPGSGRTDLDRIRDFSQFPELRWLNRHRLLPPLLYILAFGLFGGWPLMIWGGVIGTILLWHATFAVKRSHCKGRRLFRPSLCGRNR